jgi:hypothetical protein
MERMSSLLHPRKEKQFRVKSDMVRIGMYGDCGVKLSESYELLDTAVPGRWCSMKHQTLHHFNTLYKPSDINSDILQRCETVDHSFFVWDVLDLLLHMLFMNLGYVYPYRAR